jgi:hypothetical protein
MDCSVIISARFRDDRKRASRARLALQSCY